MWKRTFVVVAAALTVAACGPDQSGSQVGTVTPTVPDATAGASPSPSTVVAATATAATRSGSAQTGTSGFGATGGGTAACGQDYYRNSDGVCVHRPASGPGAPAGATAKCEDGTYSYSYSTHRSGTCSHHGGVAVWY